MRSGEPHLTQVRLTLHNGGVVVTFPRRARPTAALATVAVLAAAAGLAACGGGGGADLVVYSGRTQDLIEPLIERFETETGLAVDVRYSTDSASLALQIDAEGDRGTADVFVSQSPGAMGFLDGQGRLVAMPESLLAPVEERFRADDGHWVGLSGRVRVLVYNSNTVTPAELPDSVFELNGGRYEDRVGIAPNNPSFIDFVTALRALVGDDRTREFLEGLRDNGVRTYANNDAVLAAVAREEVDLGLINHYYNERAKQEDPEQPTENHLFEAGDPGTLILATTAGILESSDDHRPAAERFVRFLLTKESQEYFARETLEYPLAAGVSPAIDDLPPLGDIAAPDIEFAALGEEFTSTRDLIADSGLADG